MVEVVDVTGTAAESAGLTEIVQLVGPLGKITIRVHEHFRLQHSCHCLAGQNPHCLILLALIGVHARLPRHRDAR